MQHYERVELAKKIVQQLTHPEAVKFLEDNLSLLDPNEVCYFSLEDRAKRGRDTANVMDIDHHIGQDPKNQTSPISQLVEEIIDNSDRYRELNWNLTTAFFMTVYMLLFLIEDGQQIQSFREYHKTNADADQRLADEAIRIFVGQGLLGVIDLLLNETEIAKLLAEEFMYYPPLDKLGEYGLSNLKDRKLPETECSIRLYHHKDNERPPVVVIDIDYFRLPTHSNKEIDDPWKWHKEVLAIVESLGIDLDQGCITVVKTSYFHGVHNDGATNKPQRDKLKKSTMFVGQVGTWGESWYKQTQASKTRFEAFTQLAEILINNGLQLFEGSRNNLVISEFRTEEKWGRSRFDYYHYHEMLTVEALVQMGYEMNLN